MFARQKIVESKFARIAESKIRNEQIFTGNAELKNANHIYLGVPTLSIVLRTEV